MLTALFRLAHAIACRNVTHPLPCRAVHAAAVAGGWQDDVLVVNDVPGIDPAARRP